MCIAIVGQKDFGKAALDAFLKRGDSVAGVFYSPESPRRLPIRSDWRQSASVRFSAHDFKL
jgi:hypothetical protein